MSQALLVTVWSGPGEQQEQRMELGLQAFGLGQFWRV
jgi:hypothetical protein